MFDIDISNFLASLCIGTFCVFSIIFLVYLSYRLFDIRKHNTSAFLKYLSSLLRNELKQTGYTIFALIAVYTIGILAQDFTDHLADSDLSRNPFIQYLKEQNIFESEGNIRMQALVKNDNKLTGLGKEIFSNKHFNQDTIRNNHKFFVNCNVKKYWEKEGVKILHNKEKRKDFISYVNGIYYTSKNWCYLQSEPANKELSGIQVRIDLARSLAAISLITSMLSFTLYIAYILNELKKGRHKFKILICTQTKENKNKTIVKRHIFLPFKLLFILLSIFYVSRMCYYVAENNFNERAFGYYIDHLKYK